jgi:hypothetical protein
MEIKNFIKVYDEVLPWNVVSNLIRFANLSKFEETKVGGFKDAVTNFNIRKTYSLALSNTHKSLTNVHWFNLLYFFFFKKLKEYKFDLNILDYDLKDF